MFVTRSPPMADPAILVRSRLIPFTICPRGKLIEHVTSKAIFRNQSDRAVTPATISGARHGGDRSIEMRAIPDRRYRMARAEM